jgi:cell division protein ZapA
MSRAPVELRVGGQTYRVVASAEEAELRRLADVVDSRLKELAGPGRAIAPQGLLLAAISLAHDVEEERTKRVAIERRSREMLTTLLTRIDTALEQSEETPAPEPVLSDDEPRPSVDD